MRARGWAETDVGQKRDHNEDSFLCNNELCLYAVADGMGGHLGGERASSMAVEIIEQEIGQGIGFGQTGPGAGSSSTTIAEQITTTLKHAVVEATSAIFKQAQESPDHQGMGTTLTALLFHGDKVTIAHVGDSRAYLYRHGHTRQLTDDHSWIAEQVRAGLMDANDALVSRFRNIITRSVGFEPTVEPDILTLPVEAGDCFVLCSDGMSNYMDENEISGILASAFYAQAPAALIKLANERGGDDNITVVAAYAANDADEG